MIIFYLYINFSTDLYHNFRKNKSSQVTSNVKLGANLKTE